MMLEAPGIALEQHRGRTRELDLLGDAQLAREQLAGEPVLLAVEHDACAGLEDVGALPEQARVLVELRTTAPGHEDDLDVGAHARLQRTHAVDRDSSLPVAQQRRAATEQGPVEVEVQAAHAHATVTPASGGRSTGPSMTPRRRPSSWRRRATVASTVAAIGLSADSGWWRL